MNKRKRVALMKHRRKAKKLEAKRKAYVLASGGIVKPVVKAAPKKEKEMPKPVKALADILKPKEAAPVKKAPAKKEKVEVVKKPEVAEKAEKPKKAPARKKAEAAPETAAAKPESAKKATSRKKKTEES
jgi:hypothetical protein